MQYSFIESESAVKSTLIPVSLKSWIKGFRGLVMFQICNEASAGLLMLYLHTLPGFDTRVSLNKNCFVFTLIYRRALTVILSTHPVLRGVVLEISRLISA